MASLPGSCGFSFVGDSSFEFYRDPEGFISRKVQETSSSVFQSRFLNQKTVFICSYEGTRELLEEKWEDFEHGYKSFLYNSYGDNILFQNGDAASYLRNCMLPIFQGNSGHKIIEMTCDDFFQAFCIDDDKITNVYEEFKALMTKLCLQLFLGFADTTSDTSKSIAELATLHWHGIISMPISLKIPFAGESGWRKALEAKERLLHHIRENIAVTNSNKGDSTASNGSIFSSLVGLPFQNNPTDLEQHTLLFISALIPKAFSSIITSFILELAGNEKKGIRKKAASDKSYLERVLLEVQRLWPPFFGGRRIAIRNTKIGGYHIPKGYAAMYVSYFAQRDESVFVNPNLFNPDRWMSVDTPLLASHQTFTFGRGQRQCIGHSLIHRILMGIAGQLVEKYDWFLVDENPNLDYKMLPVARPSEIPSVKFTLK